MNRRNFLHAFLQTAAGAAVVHTLDLDKLLWIPGEKTIIEMPRLTTAYESTLVSVRTIERVSAGDLIYFLSPECIWQLGVADGNGGYVTHGKLFGSVAEVGPSEPLPGTYGALTRRTW